MSIADTWLLPDGVEEILPPEAARLEELRRRILDLFSSWGYDLVFPPLIEYLDSLQIGAGKDLELQTFKLTDQLTGRTLGIRPDITPQVARVVHRYFNQNLPQRLCYAGSVVHSQPRNLTASRTLIQIGLELCGSSALSSDIEVLNLMLATLHMSGCNALHLDLGHVGIFKGLMSQANLNTSDEEILIDIYHRKAVAELDEFLGSRPISSQSRTNLRVLEKLAGGVDVLDRAHAELKNVPEAVFESIQQLRHVAEQVSKQHPNITLYFDLSEIHGYNYHSGIVFAAYAQGTGNAIASGGRYDCIGERLGTAQPATGFSADLKALAALDTSNGHTTGKERKIFAPYNTHELAHRAEECTNESLGLALEKLRAQGHRIVSGLTENCSAKSCGCTHELRFNNGTWNVVTIETLT